MRNLFVLIISGLLITGAAFASEDTFSVVTVQIDKNNQIKNISGLENSLRTFKFGPKGKIKKITKVKKTDMKDKLKSTINKLSKIVGKAMKLDTNTNSKYELSGVDISLSLSTEAGIGEVFTVGGAGGIVLNFVKVQ